VSVQAEAHAAHPPAAHQSSRVDAPTLGMFLFIASEVMLFGSFFTAYFFIRVVNHEPWPPPQFHLPVFVAFVNTAILVSTFPERRGSSWLRRDLVGRLRSDAKVPVEHVVVDVATEVHA